MKYLLFLIVLLPLSLQAKIKVVTTLPDLAEVVREVGQGNVEVQSLLQGSEDPHYAEARPDFILKVNRADIVCSVGLDLEIGWLPKVLEKSGNAKVQDGGTGSCILGKTVKAVDIPTGVINRSMGDVHIHGNPHFYLSPLKLTEGADEVLRVLTTAMPDKKSELQKNYDSFKAKMQALQTKLQGQVKAKKVMEYHKEYTYFFAAYGLSSAGSLEEKPGMPPSAARIAEVAKLAKEQKVAVLFASPSAPHKTLERFKELSGVPVVVVPSYVTNKESTNSIEKLQTLLVNSIP
ncbi:metal ABC transporter substrate-binding protein [Bdellovibrio sp. HCB2-146]|uniref:metal ABC transporter substrate-binding protein n=1 Tax=Bdellovibrio sp. HCB2-146 TaxID=3394362 RepID=UPI0039BC79B0